MRDRALLHALRDQHHKDIGLCRSEIDWAVQHGRYQLPFGALQDKKAIALHRSVPTSVPKPCELKVAATQDRRAA